MGAEAVKLKLARAFGIAGWMSEDELEWLALQATRHYRIAEVGSWKGRSTVALAENTPGMVFAIDTWKGSTEHTAEDIGPEGWLFQQFVKNVWGLPILPVVGESLQVAEHFRQSGFGIFDMVFIDAAHDKESVRADIKAWRKLLRPGGLLSGHDFGTWDGLAEVVLETLGPINLATNSIWFKQVEEDSNGTL